MIDFEINLITLLIAYFGVFCLLRCFLNPLLSTLFTSVLVGLICFTFEYVLFLLINFLVIYFLESSKKAIKALTGFLILFFILYKTFPKAYSDLDLSLSYFLFNIIGFLLIKKKTTFQSTDKVILFTKMLYLPTLILGPITNLIHLKLPVSKKTSSEDINNGLMLFIWGLYKYFVISAFFNKLFYSYDSNSISGIYVILLGLLVFFDIYFKFSAAIHMVNGISLCTGIHLPLNFHGRVYFSSTRLKFWSGWHITLNMWFRNNFLYRLFKHNKHLFKFMIIPCCLIIGFWHDSTLNFILWGVLNGALIYGELIFKIKSNFIKKFNLLFVFYQLILNAVLFLILNNDADLISSLFQESFINYKPLKEMGKFYWVYFILNFLVADYIEHSYGKKGFVSFFTSCKNYLKYFIITFLASQLYIYAIEFVGVGKKMSVIYDQF